jgi:hypothetical protein
VDRRYGSREAVTGVLTPEAAREVVVLPAIDVPDVSAGRAIDDELGSGHSGGDVTLARGQDAVGRAALS